MGTHGDEEDQRGAEQGCVAVRAAGRGPRHSVSRSVLQVAVRDASVMFPGISEGVCRGPRGSARSAGHVGPSVLICFWVRFWVLKERL
jgi:hypothetical protein